MPHSLENLKQRCRTRIPKECAVHGCHNTAYQIGRFCHTHLRKRARYGHPEGRWIPTGGYLHLVADVEAILRENADHPGANAAIDWFDRWLKAAMCCEDVHAQPEMAMLALNNVSGFDLLVHAAAVVLFCLDSDEPALGTAAGIQAAIGHAILRLHREPLTRRNGATYAKPTKASAARAIGKAVHSRWAGLFAQLKVALRERAQQKRQAAEELRRRLTRPFRPLPSHNRPNPEALEEIIEHERRTDC